MEYKLGNLRCPHNQLYHKVYLLILSIELCLWNKYSKILVNKCWKLPILLRLGQLLKITLDLVAEIEAKKIQYDY
jgi:hypothetical protein